MAGIHQTLFVSPGFFFDAILAADTANYNVHDAALAAGWDGEQTVYATVKVNAGVTIGSSSTALASFVRGAFPESSIIKLLVEGSIIGRGGDGGEGGNGQGVSGHSGGPALDSSAGPMVVDSSGVIAGGGGGGGGGNSNYNSVSSGGGGGGGRGSSPGIGGLRGTGTTYNGVSGSNGSNSSGGNGGVGGYALGGAGGAGNALSSGGNGGPGLDDGGTGPGGGGGGGGGGGHGQPGGLGGPAGVYFPINSLGGAAGPAVIGNSNITWVSTGTRYGSIG